MKRSLERKLMAGAVVGGVAAVAGGAIAAAAGHSARAASSASPPTANYVSSSASTHAWTFRGPRHGGFGVRGPGDDLDAAASYLGLTTAQLQTQLQSGKTLAQIANATAGKSASGLVDALVAAEKKEIDAAVAAGKLTAAQATQIEATLTQRITDLVNGTRPAHETGGDDLDAAASYLGLTTAQLQTQLQSGKTLAQIANATAGKSASGLVDALVAAEKKEIDAAVAAGKLTSAEATQIESMLTQRVTDFVNGTPPPMHMGGGFGGHALGDVFGAAASYLGLTTAQLQTQLQSGKTLAQIANATPGKSASGLIDAIVAAAKTQIDAAVAAGKLTSAQATQIESSLTQVVTAVVNGTKPPFGGRFHGGFRGPHVFSGGGTTA